ncbi:phosphotransferase [Paenibacillus glycanilyticus]|uniref:phosphotransferase enzyme family protein n=1 Tax=Paenibacillus glycanilyticus TaxID=126569 RepID=UPI00203E5756|nr:phosphotransferase [Paenibacillus glycanilyticus]MCM3628378.1 phosphotransferase [Paenibacillus glycanilyticus]
MDFTECMKDALAKYPFRKPVGELIRHNENVTYKVIEEASGETYLLRLHKPIASSMAGVQNSIKAVQSELDFLMAWSAHSALPVQTPVPNRQGSLVTTVDCQHEEVACSILRWIDGEIVSKQDFNNEESARTLGILIADLHRFSQRYKPESDMVRQSYGMEWTNSLLTKMRDGHERGILTAEEFRSIELTLFMIMDRMNGWEKKQDSWGFIHADLNYSNLISSSKGISFIDFGLSGHGYYAMDVAMGALLVPGAYRDALLSGYTSLHGKSIDHIQLEAFMFLAIMGYYAFVLDQPDKHSWIRSHITGHIEHFCKPMLNHDRVFNTI